MDGPLGSCLKTKFMMPTWHPQVVLSYNQWCDMYQLWFC